MISFSLPMKLVNWIGRLCGVGFASAIGRSASTSDVWAWVAAPNSEQTRNPLRLVLNIKSRDKSCGERGFLGGALVLFQTADLGFAVANRDGKFALGQVRFAAQESQQLTEGWRIYQA